MGYETLVVGCGDINSCRKEIDTAKIIATDNSFTILSRHAKNAPSIARVCADSTRLPFKNNVFDNIEATHVIEHQTPKKGLETLQEINRVMDTKGEALIATPHPTYEYVLSLIFKKHHSKHMHLQVLTMKDLKQNIQSSGLIIKNESYGNGNQAIKVIGLALIEKFFPNKVRHDDQVGFTIQDKESYFINNWGKKRFTKFINKFNHITSKLIPYENVVTATK